MLYTHWCCCCTANPTWGDILECCFKAQSSKLKGLFSLKRGKRDVRALSFEPLKMSPQVGLAVLLMGCCIINQILVTLWLCVSALSRMTYVTPYTVILPSSFEDDSNHSNPVYNAFPGVSSRLLGSYPVNPSVQCVCVRVYTYTPISINIYRHVQMSICFDYSAMTPYNPYAPIVIRLCVPADKGLARRLHTCDPMFKGLYSNIHMCQCFLWIHTYHVHRKNAHCMQLPLPYMPSYNIVFIWIYSMRIYFNLNTCSRVHV